MARSHPEVIIIGAGVIGCACAFELASAGARVTVFDKRRVGQGASQASAGVLAPYIEGHEPGPLRDLGRRSLDLYDGFIERLADVGGPIVQYARPGSLEVALSAGEAETLRGSHDALRDEGVSVRWLDAHDLREAEPLATADALGGLLIDVHAYIGVRELTDALAVAAMRMGARLAPETAVKSVEPSPDGRLVVMTATGPSTADYVVLAAGSWAGQLGITGLTETIAVRPVRGQLLQLAWPTDQPLRHILWSRHCYIVPWLTGQVLLGATAEDAGFDERTTAAGVRDLLQAGCTVVPQLADASFVDARVGLRPASPDDLPIVGPSDTVPGLIYAAGHYRNGVLLAPLTAVLVKTLVFGEGHDPALDVLTPSRLGKY